MTSDEKKTLLGRILVDSRFRAAFLKNPRAAAAKLKISLSAKENEKLLGDVEVIGKNCREFDAYLQDRGADICFIPIISAH